MDLRYQIRNFSISCLLILLDFFQYFEAKVSRKLNEIAIRELMEDEFDVKSDPGINGLCDNKVVNIEKKLLIARKIHKLALGKRKIIL